MVFGNFITADEQCLPLQLRKRIVAGNDTKRVREVTVKINLCTKCHVRVPDMESPGTVDQTIPGCPRKERDKKMKRRLKMFFS